jgi:hypothetical protein
MSKHHHHDCCEHEDLAYCKVCKVAYCKDCGKEWRDNPGYSLYPHWPNTWETPTVTWGNTCGTLTTADTNGTTVTTGHNH